MKTFHLARLGWARGVRIGDDMRWGYKGISRPDWNDLGHKAYKRENPNAHPLVHSLLQCENYMQSLWDAEVKHYVECCDYDAEWREYCESECHDHDCCPANDWDTYEIAVKKMVEDEDARYRWANERLDWEWVKEYVHEVVSDDECVEYFLKEHPVEEVYCAVADEWYDLDEVAGYCFDCETPVPHKHVRRPYSAGGSPIEDTVHPHAFDPTCDICPAGDADTPESPCFFNEDSDVRMGYHCLNCNAAYPIDDLETKHERPFDWPPYVPWPPYRGWAGEYWDVPPNARI